MLSRGDAVVYKCRGVYKVEEVGKLDFSFVDGKKDYYTLQSIDNQRDKAYVPIDDDKNIRRPVSEQKAKELLDNLAFLRFLLSHSRTGQRSMRHGEMVTEAGIEVIHYLPEHFSMNRCVLYA